MWKMFSPRDMGAQVPRGQVRGLVALTQVSACIPSLTCALADLSENLIVFFEAKTQPQEQRANLSMDPGLMATGAISSGYCQPGAGHWSETPRMTRIWWNTGKAVTRRPHSCRTVCMGTSGPILSSRALHRPAAAGVADWRGGH